MSFMCVFTYLLKFRLLSGHLCENVFSLDLPYTYICISTIYQFSSEFVLLGLCFISPELPHNWLHFTFYSLSGFSFGHSLHK